MVNFKLPASSRSRDQSADPLVVKALEHNIVGRWQEGRNRETLWVFCSTSAIIRSLCNCSAAWSFWEKKKKKCDLVVIRLPVWNRKSVSHTYRKWETFTHKRPSGASEGFTVGLNNFGRQFGCLMRRSLRFHPITAAPFRRSGWWTVCVWSQFCSWLPSARLILFMMMWTWLI